MTAKKEGFLLIWTEIAACLILVLGGAALSAAAEASRSEELAAEAADLSLIGEEAMEIMKYNARFGAALPVASEMTRNGRRYTISVSESVRAVEGIFMKEAAVTVRAEDGRTTVFRSAGRSAGACFVRLSGGGGLSGRGASCRRGGPYGGKAPR